MSPIAYNYTHNTLSLFKRDLSLALPLQTGLETFWDLSRTGAFAPERIEFPLCKLQLSTSVGHYFRKCIRLKFAIPESDMSFRASAFTCRYTRIAYGITVPRLNWGGDVNPCMQTYLPMFAEARQYVGCGTDDCGFAADLDFCRSPA